MFAFDAQGQRRKPSLTPMIDVVFLLLVFILRARDGADLQNVVDVMQRLSLAGFTRLVLVE